MKVAILGYGVEGKAAFAYWSGLGAKVTIHDANTDLQVPEGAGSVLGENYLKDLKGYDLVVRSPGVKPWEIKTKAEVTSVTKEFLRKCPARIIGVTGTKGKGTTVSLIAKILESAGKRVHVGGNIGRPALELLANIKASDLVVLELSSFQLIDVDASPHVAVCLMVVPEHMDWHRSFNEYVAAKGNIFWHQNEEDVAVYNAENEAAGDIARLSRGRKVPYMRVPGAHVRAGRLLMDGTDIMGTDEVGLVGPHNLENICAAITAAWDLVGRKPGPVASAVREFRGLPHRIERLGEVGRVAFINDSYSANPTSAIAAIRSFEQPKVLILGGFDRGADFSEMAEAVAQANVRAAVLIGQTAGKIEKELNQAGFSKCSRGGKPIGAVVREAFDKAKPGDAVILSPGCPSFDMFKNFSDRGEQFRLAVEALRDEA